MTNYEILPTKLAIEPFRDNGYKNTDTAIAELIDNSIQSGLENRKKSKSGNQDKVIVDIICIEKFNDALNRSQIDKIAVLDNAGGMAFDILAVALGFGQGEHRIASKQRGMGKFGMGLPNSSISQCKRTDVYSWTKKNEYYHSYIDIDLIISEEQKSLPEPKKVDLPDDVKKIVEEKELGESGTLVIWSVLDRCKWKQSLTIANNTEFLVGRMYRKFINENKVNIRFSAYGGSGGSSYKEIFKREVKANDPMFLMTNTICPEPWNKDAPFTKWESDEFSIVNPRGEVCKLKINYSIAKEKARNWKNNSNAPGGKSDLGILAKKNQGISVIRAGRELEMNMNWHVGTDPRQRWVGIEVLFEPDLDAFMDVSNDKQQARGFFKRDISEDAENYEITETKYKEKLREEGQTDLLMHYEISQKITKRFNAMLTQIKKINKQKKSSADGAESIATAQLKKRKQTEADSRHREAKEKEKLESIIQKLIEEGLSAEEARIEAQDQIDNQIRYRFISKDLGLDQLIFDIKEENGIYFIIINQAHPAHNDLYAQLNELSIKEEEDIQSLTGLKLLLASWSRMEDEASEDLRRRIQDLRLEWGKISRDFMLENKD